MKIDPDKFLTDAQKVSVVQERIRLSGKVQGPYELRYDGSRAWDFAVRKHDAGDGVIVPRVILSVPFSSRRFRAVIEEVIQAIEDVRAGRRHYIQRGDSPFGERNLLP
jgi:hypothetical protein